MNERWILFYFLQVIARIFFVVNRSWSGLITLSELRKSNLLATIRILEEEEDINQITDFFSYEHFYVIYCKFWELDKDHDLFIDREDLSRHNDHGKVNSISPHTDIVFKKMSIVKDTRVLGVRMQIVKSNLVLRERRKDILHILEYVVLVYKKGYIFF